jgi:hypothetical protein
MFYKKDLDSSDKSNEEDSTTSSYSSADLESENNRIY